MQPQLVCESASWRWAHHPPPQHALPQQQRQQQQSHSCHLLCSTHCVVIHAPHWPLSFLPTLTCLCHNAAVTATGLGCSHVNATCKSQQQATAVLHRPNVVQDATQSTALPANPNPTTASLTQHPCGQSIGPFQQLQAPATQLGQRPSDYVRCACPSKACQPAAP